MKNIFYFANVTRTSLVYFLVALLSLHLNSAFASASTPATNNSGSLPAAVTLKMIQNVGEPVRLEFSDGRVANFVVENDPRPFDTTLVLTENSCAPRQAATCDIHFPRRVLRYSLKWAKNPGSVGNAVRKVVRDQGKIVKTEPIGTSAVDFAFAQRGKILSADAIMSPYAELQCNHDDWIPWQDLKSKQTVTKQATEIVGWDEDFEQGNNEFLYFRGGDTPSFNSITGHFESIQLIKSGSKILLGTPTIVHDLFTGFIFFPLIGYKLQLTFPSQSLADADDLMCQAKLTIDFTQIFTEATRLFPRGDQGDAWDLAPFKPLIGGSYEHEQLQSVFKQESAWSYSEYQ